MENVEQQTSGGDLAFPIAEGFRRIGIKPTKGSELVKEGVLQTFTIGHRRYITGREISRFIAARIEAAKQESAAERAAKVRPAVEERARRREEERAKAAA